MTDKPRVTCPVCGRPGLGMSSLGRINRHNDRRQPRTGNPYDQECGASGVFREDAEKLRHIPHATITEEIQRSRR